MRYVFLTACRNEQATLPDFFREFTEVLATAGITRQSVLYVVDDLSTDRTVDLLEEYRSAARPSGLTVEILRAPTNLGNQGALFHGLSRLTLGPSDVLVTFDSDGEDDVRQIPSLVELGAENPGKVIYIERGRRKESLTFRVAFGCYKLLFRFLTRQTVIPNNFLWIPGQYVRFIRRAPLAAVHFAYAVLKLRLPSLCIQRDRRARYGGSSSQNLFMVASHGLVGLMVFYETVIAKLLYLLASFGVFALAVVGLALYIPNVIVQRTLLLGSVAMAAVGAGFFSLLMAAALALMFKMSVFTLSRLGPLDDEAPTAPTPRAPAVGGGPGVAPPGTAGKRPS